MVLPSILVLKLSIWHHSCTDCFLFRRKTLNEVVREFSVNWLFRTDECWCWNVSLVKQWLSYHSLHEPGPHRSQILCICLSQLWAWKGGGRGKMVRIGGRAQRAWWSSSSAKAGCQTRLGSQQIYTDTAVNLQQYSKGCDHSDTNLLYLLP